MHHSPTLLVLAAGMATRYGSLKQLEGFGPNGETIIDYSVHDALKAGFSKIVFVIRESIEKEFRAAMAKRLPGAIQVDFVTQELHLLPAGFEVPENRTKPWGTGHAVWVAASKIQESFAVINGDDFYGGTSFQLVADFLRNESNEAVYGLVGFRLENTLSAHGAVSRGICKLDAQGNLQTLTELTHIERTDQGIVAQNTGAAAIPLEGDELVSMNLMAFKPAVFPSFEQEFIKFLEYQRHEPKAEFYLPAVVDAVIRSGQAKVKVLETPEKWFGVTYPEDKAVTTESIYHLIAAGLYPHALWAGDQPQNAAQTVHPSTEKI